MNKILKHFFIGGILFSFLSYIANQVDPIIAGLITGLPVGLFTIYFVMDYNTSQQFAFVDLFSCLLMTLVTLIFYYIYTIKKIPKKRALFFSISLWIILTFIILQQFDNNKEIRLIKNRFKFIR